MKNQKTNFLKNWLPAVSIAVFLTVILKLFFFQNYINKDKSGNTDLQKGDLVIVSKKFSAKYNDILLLKYAENKTFKRCVGLPGDKLAIKNSKLYINDQFVEDDSIFVKKKYRIFAFDSIQNEAIANYYKLAKQKKNIKIYDVLLNFNALNRLKNDSLLTNIEQVIEPKGVQDTTIFHRSELFLWNKDNFGAIIIPHKSMTMKLGKKTYFVYKSLIEKEIGQELTFKNDKIFVNNQVLENYTFQNNYYFVLNDNRNDTNDSRQWGLISEKQIIGKKLFVLLNL